MTQARAPLSVSNIDALCARCGSEIARRKAEVPDAKRLATICRNALGVMREQGLYAFCLFLQYRWDDGGRVIWPPVNDLWRDQALGPLLAGEGGERDQVIALTSNLQDLLLAREVTERALIYALYGLRAEKE